MGLDFSRESDQPFGGAHWTGFGLGTAVKGTNSVGEQVRPVQMSC